MTATILSIRRSLAPADVQRAMVATIAAVAAEPATGVQTRELVTMACAFNDVCVALGIIAPPDIAQLVDR